MLKQPTFTVSGYRGVWGDSLNQEITSLYTRAFIRFLKEDQENQRPRILIGRDGRESGQEIKEAIIKELEKYGVDFIDGGILPTPTVIYAVRNHKYDGAIIITASHNPREYNGLKFINNQAFFLNKNQVIKINKYTEQEKLQVAEIPGTFINNEIEIPNFIKEHADEILKHLDLHSIRTKNFKIAVDMINASACEMDPYLFGELGIELLPINNIPNGDFKHAPEPLKQNLTEIADYVKKTGAHLGFAHDPDADRLVVIDENGHIVSEEYTLALCLENILEKNPNNKIVINLSTSKTNELIAKKYNNECILSPVGEINVVEEMTKNKAIIGGEGSGGVIYPTINNCRDGFVAIGLILELIAKRDKKVSQIVNEFPQFFIKKFKGQLDFDFEQKKTQLKEIFKEAKITEIDGIRFDFPDNAWVSLRISNTEPIFRLFGEAINEERIESLFKEVLLTFENN